MSGEDMLVNKDNSQSLKTARTTCNMYENDWGTDQMSGVDTYNCACEVQVSSAD